MKLICLLAAVTVIGCIEAPHAMDDPLVDPEERIDGVEPLPAGQRGMTWRLNRRFLEDEVVDVGCGGEPGRCDAYEGDTDCRTSLPLLCFHPVDADQPAGVPEGGRYHTWSAGMVRLSSPRAPVGDALDTVADASAVCAQELGEGWRIAHFHDGWGWNFRAFGMLTEIDVRDHRFWVDIQDQPRGTCWGR